MFNLQLALRPFKDTRILPKAGFILGVYVISAILEYLINVATSLPVLFPSSVDTGSVIDISTFLSLAASIIVSIIIFPATLYLSGYSYTIADRIRTNAEESLPEHDSIMKMIKLGGIALSFSILLSVPLIVLAGIVFLAFSVAGGTAGILTGTLTGGSLAGPAIYGVIAAFSLLFVLLGLYFAFLDIFILPIFMYRYLTTLNYTMSLSFKHFVKILKVSWLDWLAVFGIILVLNIVSFGVQAILCCLGPLIAPFVKTFTVLAAAGLTGAVYNKIESVLAKDPGVVGAVGTETENGAEITSGSNSAG